MTDNAWNYTHSPAFSDVLRPGDIKHLLMRPHCPWQNGKVERFNRTLQTEWAYRTVFDSNDQRTSGLRPGSTNTTLAAATQHSEGCLPSAACHEPDGRVHLVTRSSFTDARRDATYSVGTRRRKVLSSILSSDRSGIGPISSAPHKVGGRSRTRRT